MGTGTQMWADWKCEHKNKVKREMTILLKSPQIGMSSGWSIRVMAQGGMIEQSDLHR